MLNPRIIGSERYVRTLEWVRSLNIPNKPHRLPDQKEFTRMVFERPENGYRSFDVFEDKRQGISKEYVLAYMEVMLERANEGTSSTN